ncbi:MAG: lipopolysaccharide biosynthesis protein [Bacteroidales bacterium]|nr:lipopolysaccharide biosynthesis protein [Bacteroidales bacterium]
MQQQDKKKLSNSFIWSAVQRFGTRIMLFITNLVLARLLSPSDFGCLGIMMVFTEFSSIFINGGFASALIQKKNPSQVDYSSVFFVNMGMSVFFFVAFFLGASPIASFYQNPVLCDVLRVQGLVLIFNAFNVVQINILQKRLDFRRLAVAENVSCFISCGVSIVAAYMDFGVWSFVVKNIGLSLLYSLILWFWDSWRPSLLFSFKSVRELFQFGGFIMLSSLAESIYDNMQPLIIGKAFSSRDLGYFTQARKLQEIPIMGLSHMVSSVSYPLYSRLQDDKQDLLNMLRRNIKAITYINFPLMVLLMIAAKPVMVLFFGDKWLPSVPYFQILCMAGLIMPVNISNRDLFAALGRSRVSFRVQIAYEIVGIALIVGGMHFGIEGLIWGRVAAYYFLFVLNAAIARRLIGYGLWAQLRDVLPNLAISLLAGAGIYLLAQRLHLAPLLQTLSIGATYAALYLLLSVVTHNTTFVLFWHLGKGFVVRYMPWADKQKG